MTIDEYLNQLPKLKAAENHKYNKLMKMFDIATSTHNSAFDGMPRTRNSENAIETKLIEYADTKREWDEIHRRFYEIKEQIEDAIDYLLYWEGSLIYRVYIYNIFGTRDDPMEGADEILHTNSQYIINVKLAEAKSHLRQILINQGVELD